jgi:hypothetical protein
VTCSTIAHKNQVENEKCDTNGVEDDYPAPSMTVTLPSEYPTRSLKSLPQENYQASTNLLENMNNFLKLITFE